MKRPIKFDLSIGRKKGDPFYGIIIFETKEAMYAYEKKNQETFRFGPDEGHYNFEAITHRYVGWLSSNFWSEYYKRVPGAEPDNFRRRSGLVGEIQDAPKGSLDP